MMYGCPIIDRPAVAGCICIYTGKPGVHHPGQVQHLPHELGHVVQQSGESSADTRHASGVKMNTDPVLERQADEIGRAVGGNGMVQGMAVSDGPVQRNPLTSRLTENVWEDFHRRHITSYRRIC